MSLFYRFKNILPFIILVILAGAFNTFLQSQDLTNPFKVKVERVEPYNTTQVRVKIWSDVDISGFPTTDPVSPPAPWADSVWVMYKTFGYAQSVSEASVAMYSTEAIKQATPDSLINILTVGDLPFPNDSCWWFNYSVLWHIPSNPDSLLRPFLQANKVFMVDTPPRPVYTGVLNADSTTVGDRMHVDWDAPPPGTDSLRIWFNISPIPLSHDPGLSISKAYYVIPLTKTVDTIPGLSYNTIYYFGLQIFDDSLWSVITELSSDTAKTAFSTSIKEPLPPYVPLNKQQIKITQRNTFQGISIQIFFSNLVREVDASLLSLNGKEIAFQYGSRIKALELEFSRPASGIYFLQLSGNNAIVTHKILFTR